MLKLRIFVGTVLCLLTACTAAAGVLTVQCKAPTTSQDGGTCSEPVLVPRNPADSVTVHFRWAGVSAGEDSVRVAPGAIARLSDRVVPPGDYIVYAWASDRDGAGCVTSITKRVSAVPGAVEELK